jgi:tRNA(His) 5'-end guanylyltransferase
MSIKGLFTRAVIFVSHSSDQFISVHVERSWNHCLYKYTLWQLYTKALLCLP